MHCIVYTAPASFPNGRRVLSGASDGCETRELRSEVHSDRTLHLYRATMPEYNVYARVYPLGRQGGCIRAS
eukprot:7384968-Prymnesium_polylepis.1